MLSEIKSLSLIFALVLFGNPRLLLEKVDCKRRGQSETLLNTCMETHTNSNGADLLSYINAYNWLNGDFDKSQLKVSIYMKRSID